MQRWYCKRWNFKYGLKASKTQNLNVTSDKFQNTHFKIAKRDLNLSAASD